jgi:CRISPR-associated endonuclease Cas1 subtype II
MSWRTVVIASSAKLDYQMGYLVVRRDDIKKVYMDEISILIIENTAVSLTAALLSVLTKKKVKVIFCDEKRNPSSELIPYAGSHNSSLKIRNQIKWSDTIKEAVWTVIVADKIRKQAELLQELHKPQAELLLSYIKDIQMGDVTNREGHAAKVYFNALFGLGFLRAEECAINAALNYGYGLILSAFNREIVKNGYITQLGLYHDNMFNQFNLGSDLMEPFRIVVDRLVVELQPEMFDHEEKIYMLGVFEKYVKIADRKETVLNAIKIYTKSIFDALEDQDTSLIRLYKYEL